MYKGGQTKPLLSSKILETHLTAWPGIPVPLAREALQQILRFFSINFRV